jgi:hypothetical protein
LDAATADVEDQVRMAKKEAAAMTAAPSATNGQAATGRWLSLVAFCGLMVYSFLAVARSDRGVREP